MNRIPQRWKIDTKEDTILGRPRVDGKIWITFPPINPLNEFRRILYKITSIKDNIIYLKKDMLTRQ